MAQLDPFTRLHLVAGGFEFLLKQAERHGKAVDGSRRCRRAAGDIDIYRHDLVGAAPDAVEVVEDAAVTAAGAVGDADLGIGAAS